MNQMLQHRLVHKWAASIAKNVSIESSQIVRQSQAAVIIGIYAYIYLF